MSGKKAQPDAAEMAEGPMAPGSRVKFSHPVLNHFYQPRNAGIAANYNRYYLEENNLWDVRLLFTLRVEEGRIQEVKFKARSCVTTVACASALTEMVEGKDVDSALAIRPEELSQALGAVPVEKMYCCRLVIATLHQALHSPVPVQSEKSHSQGDSS